MTLGFMGKRQAAGKTRRMGHAGWNPGASGANGTQHPHSDIDLALWDDKFTGSLTVDYEPIKRILTRFPLIELHTFPSDEDKFSNPFIAEIIKTGILLDGLLSSDHTLAQA